MENTQVNVLDTTTQQTAPTVTGTWLASSLTGMPKDAEVCNIQRGPNTFTVHGRNIAVSLSVHSTLHHENAKPVISFAEYVAKLDSAVTNVADIQNNPHHYPLCGCPDSHLVKESMEWVSFNGQDLLVDCIVNG